MINITLPNGENRFFRNYHQVCDYINAIERAKSLTPDGRTWRFITRHYEALYSLYYQSSSLKYDLTYKEREAIEKEMGLVEIIRGNRDHITQLLVTDTIDAEPLKRDWCIDYCLDQELEITESIV